MMKKTIFAALALAAAGPALAQSEQTIQNGDFTETVEYSNDKYKVETNHFWDNWFLSVGAGPQVMFGDHDKQIGLGKRISPALDIAVGKWFTPGIGVRLMYNGLSLKGATRWGEAHSTGEQVSGWGSGMYYSSSSITTCVPMYCLICLTCSAVTRKTVSGTAASMVVWDTCAHGKLLPLVM